MPADDIETPGGEPSDDETGAPRVNAAEPASLRKARARASLRKEEASDFWRRALGSEVGRRELWGVLASAHAFDERFACGPNGFPQPEATWFEAGQQALGFRLYLSWLRLAPEGVGLMMAENHPALADPKRRPPSRKPA